MTRFSNLLTRRFCIFILSFLCTLTSTAQEQQVDMADAMRSNGKIYIVVTVCLTILIGLFLYVFTIDRKISRLEKENK